MISALTEAVQDVVEIIKIVVAVLHDSPVAHGVIEQAIGVCHCTRTGRGDKGAEKTITGQLVTSTEDKQFKQTKVRSRSTILVQPGLLPRPPAFLRGTLAPLTCWALVGVPKLAPRPPSAFT